MKCWIYNKITARDDSISVFSDNGIRDGYGRPVYYRRLIWAEFEFLLTSRSVYLLTTLAWPVEMVYWSSYETTLNSSSDVQWTVMVS